MCACVYVSQCLCLCMHLFCTPRLQSFVTSIGMLFQCFIILYWLYLNVYFSLFCFLYHLSLFCIFSFFYFFFFFISTASKISSILNVPFLLSLFFFHRYVKAWPCLGVLYSICSGFPSLFLEVLLLHFQISTEFILMLLQISKLQLQSQVSCPNN